MFDIMNQAKNAIQAYNTALSIHSSNIANMSVNGYKRLNISFDTVLNQLMNSGSPASTFSDLGGTNPLQLGGGVGVADIQVDFTQGSFVDASTIDLGISGNGLFVVSSDGGSTYRYTRCGDFSVSNGNLVTSSGYQVYGLNSSGSLVPISSLSGTSTDYSWNSSTGDLLYSGVSTGYRIALSTFTNPQGLAQTDGTTFEETLSSGSAATPAAVGGSAGTIQTGKIEQSNVFYLGETIDSLEIQRALNGNLSIVKMASDIISSVISKLG